MPNFCPAMSLTCLNNKRPLLNKDHYDAAFVELNLMERLLIKIITLVCVIQCIYAYITGDLKIKSVFLATYIVLCFTNVKPTHRRHHGGCNLLAGLLHTCVQTSFALLLSSPSNTLLYHAFSISSVNPGIIGEQSSATTMWMSGQVLHLISDFTSSLTPILH